MNLHVFDESQQWGHYDSVTHGHEHRTSQPSTSGVELKGDYEMYIAAPAPPTPLPVVAHAPLALAASPEDKIFGLPRQLFLAAGFGVATILALFLYARRRS